MRGVLCAVTVIAASPVFADDKTAVRELSLKGVRVVAVEDFGFPKDIEIGTAGQLQDSPLFEDAPSRDAIAKQVNFDREKLVVFAWTGSVNDRLTPEPISTKKKLTAVFVYTAGKTTARCRHALVFAVPKDTIVEVK